MADLDTMKQRLDSWREVAVLLYSVITWEQDLYPAVTAGLVTAGYVLVYWLSPSLVTLASCLCLVATLLDYLVPLLADMIIPRTSWTEAKDKKLEVVARFLVTMSQLVASTCAKYREARTQAPVYHVAITSITLLTTAFLGTMVSGIWLSYLVLMLALMLPGLHSRGLLAEYCGSLVTYAEEMVKGKKRE